MYRALLTAAFLLLLAACGGSGSSNNDALIPNTKPSEAPGPTSEPTCTNNTSRCSTNNSGIEKCTNGQWQLLQSCALNEVCFTAQSTASCSRNTLSCISDSQCDDQKSCSEDTCGEDGQCLNSVIDDCTELEYAFDIPLNLPSADDFDTVFYLDPDYNGSDSDGSLEKPYRSWQPLRTQMTELSNAAFLQKRGTSTVADFDYGNVSVEGSNILIGAYGDATDAMPIIYDANILLEGENIVMRGLEIIGTSTSSYTHAVILHGKYNVLYGNKIHGQNATENYIGYCISGSSYGSKILYNEIYNCYQDAIYGAGDYIEIGHNKIYNIDISHAGPADIIQFIYNTCAGYWIHHNDFDGREIDNKFAVITNCDSSEKGAYGIIEHNYMIMANRPMLHLVGKAIIRNNHFVQESDRNPAVDGFEPAIWSHLSDLEAYNNLLDNTSLYSSKPGNTLALNNTFIYRPDKHKAASPRTL